MVLLVEYIAFPSIFAQPRLLPQSHHALVLMLHWIQFWVLHFFEDRGSKVTGTRVISNNPVQTEDSFVAR
jgi:hypothetical protein